MVERPDSRDVVVTGMAWKTSLGDDVDEVWARLLKGETGFASVVPDYPVRNDKIGIYNTSHLTKPPSCRLIENARSVANRAVDHAMLTNLGSTNQRLVAATSLGVWLDGAKYDVKDDWSHQIFPDHFDPKTIISLSTACSSGSDSILVGASLIQSGEADVCICISSDVVTDTKRLAHSALSTMTPDIPKAFNRNANGMLLGEGAACIILESYGHATARDAKIIVNVVGCGSANDAGTYTAPNTDLLGPTLAIKRALKSAKLTANDVSIIQAHGSGTALNDKTETLVFERLFSAEETIPIVFATKSNFGHTLGATGAIEFITLAKALQSQCVPPNVGLIEPISEHGFHLTRSVEDKNIGDIGISLTLGFGGYDTAIVVKAAHNGA